MLQKVIYVFALSLVFAACEKTYIGRTNTPYPIREFKVLGRASTCADTTWLITGIGNPSSDSIFITTNIPESYRKEGNIIYAKYMELPPNNGYYFFCPGGTPGEAANYIYIIEVVGSR